MESYRRLHSTRRVIETIILLSSRPYTRRQLAEKHKVDIKTISRDLGCIEALDIPLYQELIYDDTSESEFVAGAQSIAYRIDRHWMRRFV